MVNKFYVTTPIYYSNSKPHVGSAYTTIAADTFARWNKSLGKDVFFLTGTDEHGQKIQETAKKNKKEPKEFVDEIAKKFKEIFKLLNISNDNFIRTTDKYHEKEVKEVLQKLYDKKYIYKGIYESSYCIGCEQYLTKSDLVEDKCPLHNKKPEIRKEEAYLFKLSEFQEQLYDLINSGKFGIFPEKRRKEVLGFIKNGLNDISISRLKKNVSWGIELPFDKEHTCFVWLDAFWNYYSGLKTKKDKFWPADLQLMAKDILRVHATIWPAMLLALNKKLPKVIFVHGFFTINGQKMSKSLGNAIDPKYLSEKYGVDALRYYLLKNIPFGDDGDFNELKLKNSLNNELANDLGNLVNRTLTLCEKFFNGKLSKQKEDGLIKKLNLNKIQKQIDKFELHNALEEIWKFIRDSNKYVNDKEPWKNEKNREMVLYNLLESLRIISILIQPFIPETSDKINKQLGVKPGNLKNIKFGLVKDYKIKKGEILFKKIEDGS
jgi:methionyl-tRNA synthetase